MATLKRPVTKAASEEFLVQKFRVCHTRLIYVDITFRFMFLACVLLPWFFGASSAPRAALIPSIGLLMAMLWYAERRRQYIEIRFLEEILATSSDGELEDTYIKAKYDHHNPMSDVLKRVIHAEPFAWVIMLFAFALCGLLKM